MNRFYALAASFALVAAPATAAVTVVYEDSGGPVVSGRSEGGTLNFAPLSPGIYDLIFQFSDQKGCCATFFVFASQYTSEERELRLKRPYRYSRRLETYRFRVSEDESISNIGYNVQNDLLEGSFTYNIRIAAVPEPSAWVLMIFGFGLVGYTMRRRSKVVFGCS